MAKLEAYLWFLFLQCLSEKKYVQRTGGYIVRAVWENHFLQQLTQYYRKYQENSETITLKGFLATLPADYEQKLKTLGMNKSFVKFLLKNDLEEEWQKAMTAHKEMVRVSQSQAWQKELAELDKVETLTGEQEQRQKEILQSLRELTKKTTAESTS